MKKIPAGGVLRTVALVVLLVGAAGSLGLMLHAGRNNNSVLLLVLFAGWVLSPFIALLIANGVSTRWSGLTRVTLYILMLVLAAGSLVSYSGVFHLPGRKPAFVFLIVPLASWLIIAIVIPVAASFSRRLSRTGHRV